MLIRRMMCEKEVELMQDWETMFMESKPVECSDCKGKMKYIGSGTYQCEKCKKEEKDAFGKVKEYLNEHGPTPIVVLQEETGVHQSLLQAFLRNGSLEIPEGSKYYLGCQKCGCSIRYGRFCPECTRELAGGIKTAFNADMGERPKTVTGDGSKMHFLNRKKR